MVSSLDSYLTTIYTFYRYIYERRVPAMKKRLLSASTLIALVVQLIGCMPVAAAAPTKIPKFLILGNSFARDAMDEFHHVLKAEGVKEYTIGYLFHEACTLEMHAGYAKSGEKQYSYRKVTNEMSAWDKPANYPHTMLDGVLDEPWDYIFLQGATVDVAERETYQDLDFLLEYLKEHATNPNVKFGWHMTWAFAGTFYEQRPTWGKYFDERFQRNPQLMFKGIAEAVQAEVLSRPFSIVIPSGTAIENARTSHKGDVMQRDDGYHLNTFGKLIAAYCWYSALTGEPVKSIKHIPSSLPYGLTVSERDKAMIVEAVNNAVKTPYAITPSSFYSLYNLSVSGGGQAEIGGKPVTQAPAGATVTLRFDITSKCTKFNGWDVSQSNITLADRTNPVTTFVMPDTNVSIRANVTDNCPSKNMADVSATGWYHEAVDYVLNNGIMSGYDASTFGTNDTLTRAQVVQVLYNKEGKPAVTAENQFKDVSADQWYFDAVRWAADKGVVSGVGDGNFNPNGKITLEQAAVILHNYSGKPTSYVQLNAIKGLIGNHSSWAVDALRWSVSNGLLKSVPFENATDAATRAQTAQILYNYLSK